jgi:hypothetical protein
MKFRSVARPFGLAVLLMFLLPALAAAQAPAVPDSTAQAPVVQATTVPATAQPAAKSPADARAAWVADYRWLGAGLSASFPYAEFGDEFNTGYGAHIIVDKPLWPLINLSGDVGYTHFAGNEEHEDADIWNLLVGARLAFGAFFIGGEGGWFTEVDDLGWVPSMGVRFEKLEVGLRWITSGSNSWTTVRAGYYF